MVVVFSEYNLYEEAWDEGAEEEEEYVEEIDERLQEVELENLVDKKGEMPC